jgi:hypothetical protein
VFPDNVSHPFTEGWLRIFGSWSKIDVVRDAWSRYGDSYSKAFQIFAESHAGFPRCNGHGS